ncbi:hypothetical protein [uncultured Pseudoteredinibacter sp.]|uniref:hypothetical protein n=1 Tax=uncultured Pseudoteredinibacter sp. TaxID=1641701 RepID=UPI002624D588|nr:hypothetical protein [uncultured Pseudoteredinibacter sp.]
MNLKLLLILAISLLPMATLAQVSLETPANQSVVSGVGLVRGWACDASAIELSIDDGKYRVPMLYGGDRSDTADRCDNDGLNGFGTVVFWPNFGLGEHSAELIVDGVSVQSSNFIVESVSGVFVKGLSGGVAVPDFPNAGETSYLAWSEADQNFIVDYKAAKGEVKKKLTIDVGELQATAEFDLDPDIEYRFGGKIRVGGSENAHIFTLIDASGAEHSAGHGYGPNKATSIIPINQPNNSEVYRKVRITVYSKYTVNSDHTVSPLPSDVRTEFIITLKEGDFLQL